MDRAAAERVDVEVPPKLHRGRDAEERLHGARGLPVSFFFFFLVCYVRSFVVKFCVRASFHQLLVWNLLLDLLHLSFFLIGMMDGWIEFMNS